jgi:ribosome-binding factor A
MSNRKIRVGELIKREVSDILHTRFKGRYVMITITDVDVSPDNKNAKVFYSVIETKEHTRGHAQRFLESNEALIKRELGKRIVLKYMPSLQFVLDEKNLAAARVHELLDSLGASEGMEEAGHEGEDEP